MMAMIMIVIIHMIKNPSTNLERTLMIKTHYFYFNDCFVIIIVDYCINSYAVLNPLNAELNLICCFLALLGDHNFLHVSRIRVKSLTLRLLMSYIYIYMENPFLMFLDHTQRRPTVGRTPLDE